MGSAERNLKMLREALGVTVASRDGVIRITGGRGAVTAARGVLEELGRHARARGPLTRHQVLELIAEASSRAGDAPGLDPDDPDAAATPSGPRDHAHTQGPPAPPGFASTIGGAAWDGRLHVFVGGRPVAPKTPGQHAYLEAIRDHELVLGMGPAGTGKTYLAVAAAVHLLKTGRVQRVVLARPAVEAGERLGFLPGDLQDKVNPYLRPLLDALHDMLDYATLRRFMDNDVIEISPLAFMRGRTLNNAVVLLDEAQNTTRGQMQMFLTRMGQGSRMIITGDVTQVDLPDPTQSGLIDAARRLRRVPGVALCQLSGADVVRHHLVQRIIEAYGGDAPDAPSPTDWTRDPIPSRDSTPRPLPPRSPAAPE